LKIIIHARHFKVSDALTQYVNDKISSLARHDHDIINIEVTLISENKLTKAEAKIHVPGAEIFASAENEDMYVAIDKLIPKLDRQITKHKEKTQNKK
jgi:putative sigma-54 modulation protein